jgi:hypothetical protein
VKSQLLASQLRRWWEEATPRKPRRPCRRAKIGFVDVNAYISNHIILYIICVLCVYPLYNSLHSAPLCLWLLFSTLYRFDSSNELTTWKYCSTTVPKSWMVNETAMGKLRFQHKRKMTPCRKIGSGDSCNMIWPSSGTAKNRMHQD